MGFLTELQGCRQAERLFEKIDPVAHIHVARWVLRMYGKPLTNAERAKRHREASRTTVTENRHEQPSRTTVTENRHEQPSRKRDGPPLQPPVIYTQAGFEGFWKHYPKRIGKGAAYKAWKDKNCESMCENVIKALQGQIGYLTRDNGQFIPNPATWLNQRRWEDEVPQEDTEWRGLTR